MQSAREAASPRWSVDVSGTCIHTEAALVLAPAAKHCFAACAPCNISARVMAIDVPDDETSSTSCSRSESTGCNESSSESSSSSTRCKAAESGEKRSSEEAGSSRSTATATKGGRVGSKDPQQRSAPKARIYYGMGGGFSCSCLWGIASKGVSVFSGFHVPPEVSCAPKCGTQRRGAVGGAARKRGVTRVESRARGARAAGSSRSAQNSMPCHHAPRMSLHRPPRHARPLQPPSPGRVWGPTGP